MLDGSPPPRPSGPAAERLEAARGSMRDMLGAIRNLEQLLRSIRVGPRALAAVVPDVHESCAPLRAAMQELVSALEARLPDPARAIGEFVSPRIEELERALASARDTTMNAKGRLALENVVTRLARELDVARSMIELLEEALGGVSARLDLVELTTEAFKGAEYRERGPAQPVSATLDRGQSVDVRANPRVATCLVALAAGLVVASDSGAVLHVAVGRAPSGSGTVTISRGPGQGEALQLVAAPRIGPMLQCAQAAARATQTRFEVSEDEARISIVWLPAEE
jgi:hypothetical protein